MSDRSILFATTVPVTLRAFLLPYARVLRSQGWSVHAAARQLSSEPDLCREFDAVWDIEWSRNPMDIANMTHAARRIGSIVKSEAYDIVHVHTPVAALVTRFSTRRFHRSWKPVTIYTAHGFHFHSGGGALTNRLYLQLEKIAGRWTDYLVVINSEDYQAVLSHEIVPKVSLRYMPGIGIDTGYYSPERVTADDLRAVRAEIGIGNDTPLFLMIAAFDPGKRHRDAIRALRHMRNKRVHLALVGSGTLVESMKQLVEQLGLIDRVHFLGYRTDIPALIRSSVATLLPSEREGLPRSVMESMALQTPVIGADARGTRDLLHDGGGVLVNVGDVEALARTMDWIIEHPQEARALGLEGRRTIRSKYDIEHIVRLHHELYEEALERRRSRKGASILG